MFATTLVFLLAVDGGPPPAVDRSQGLSRDAVNQVVRSHLNGIKYCYESQLQKNPTLSGGMDVAWEIEADGHVSGTRIAGSTMNDKTVEDCIARQVASWRFPAASKRTVVARYPFIFKSGPGTATPAKPSPDAGAPPSSTSPPERGSDRGPKARG